MIHSLKTEASSLIEWLNATVWPRSKTQSGVKASLQGFWSLRLSDMIIIYLKEIVDVKFTRDMHSRSYFVLDVIITNTTLHHETAAREYCFHRRVGNILFI